MFAHSVPTSPPPPILTNPLLVRKQSMLKSSMSINELKQIQPPPQQQPTPLLTTPPHPRPTAVTAFDFYGGNNAPTRKPLNTSRRHRPSPGQLDQLRSHPINRLSYPLPPPPSPTLPPTPTHEIRVNDLKLNQTVLDMLKNEPHPFGPMVPPSSGL